MDTKSNLTIYSQVNITDAPPPIYGISDNAPTEPSERPPLFKTVAYDGGLIFNETYLSKFGLAVAIDLQGLEYSPSLKVNLDHDDTKRVGHITQHINDGKTLTLEGAFSGSNSFAKSVADTARKSGTQTCEVEIEPLKIDRLADRETLRINGQTILGPAMVFRKSKLRGLAFMSPSRQAQVSPVDVYASLETFRITSVGDAVSENLKHFEKLLFENSQYFKPHQIAEIKAEAVQELIALKRFAITKGWTAKMIDDEAAAVVFKYLDRCKQAAIR